LVILSGCPWAGGLVRFREGRSTFGLRPNLPCHQLVHPFSYAALNRRTQARRLGKPGQAGRLSVLYRTVLLTAGTDYCTNPRQDGKPQWCASASAQTLASLVGFKTLAEGGLTFQPDNIHNRYPQFFQMRIYWQQRNALLEGRYLRTMHSSSSALDVRLSSHSISATALEQVLLRLFHLPRYAPLAKPH
jgi:hypothetical protein